MIVRTFRIDGKPAIQLDKEPAIIVREPDATMQPTLQDNQLMSKHRVLGFKPQLRLEWRGQHGQSEIEQPDHSASLGDSITSSTRIRFPVHTGIEDAASSSAANTASPTAPSLTGAASCPSQSISPRSVRASSADMNVMDWLLRALSESTTS